MKLSFTVVNVRNGVSKLIEQRLEGVYYVKGVLNLGHVVRTDTRNVERHGDGPLREQYLGVTDNQN